MTHPQSTRNDNLSLADKRDALIGVLTQDPRPRYQTDASRVYGLEFGGYEIKFRVDSQTLTVTDIAKKDS